MLAGFALALAAGAAAPPAMAQETEASVPTMIVLDGSGSMLEADAPGPRIDAAKKAVNRLIKDLPSDAQVGLMAYGTGTSSAASDEAAGCRDVKTLLPVDVVDRKAMTSAVKGIKASGYTPIGLALKKAAKELPNGEGAIVLVSDGIDTCSPPPPCKVAKSLAADGIDMTVHTVGFRVDADARKELKCIAKATDGTYADARDADQLSEALEVKVEYSITGYHAKGTPIEGALTDQDEMPQLESGQWVDTFYAKDLSPFDWNGQARGNNQGFRYYRLNVPEDFRAYVTATLAPTSVAEASSKSWLGVQTKIIGSDGSTCAEQRETTSSVSRTMMPPIAAVETDCTGDLVVEVRRDGKSLEKEDLPVEIVVRLEPILSAGDLPEPEEQAGPKPPVNEADSAVDLAGGTSFNTAPELLPGQTYRSEIGAGEAKFFRVPLAWGQQMSYSVDFAKRIEGEEGLMSTVRTAVHSPLREEISPPETEMNGVWFTRDKIDPKNASWSTPEPVRYGSDLYGMDGFYYISIAEEANNESFVLDSYLITVDVAGDPEPGPTSLAAEEPDSEPTPSAEAPAPDATADAEQSSGSALPWILAGVGLLVVAAAVGAGFLVKRRRKKSAPEQWAPPSPPTE